MATFGRRTTRPCRTCAFGWSGRGLDGLTSAEVSDAEGLVQVQAICPAQSLAGGRILADLAAVANDPAAAVAVQVRTDTVDELTVVEHGTWPTTLRSGGTPLTLRIQALDAAGAPVVRAGLRPDDDAPDPREPLRLVVSIASQGHAGRILVEDGNGALTVPLVEQTLVVDQDLAPRISTSKPCPATFDNPTVPRGRARLAGLGAACCMLGADAHQRSPAVWSALSRSAAGSFAFSVWDGEPGLAPTGAGRPDQRIGPRSQNAAIDHHHRAYGERRRFVVDVPRTHRDHALEARSGGRASSGAGDRARRRVRWLQRSKYGSLVRRCPWSRPRAARRCPR